MGLTSSILSGDSQPAVRTVAQELGIDDARSGLSPAGKVGALNAMRDDSRPVVMVGDGVNDAPALAAADVGCAIGSGSEAAVANSGVALLGSDLQGVPAAIGVARSTYAVIVQNFGWAMGYNLAALPLAAFGLLDPLVAAVAMGLSSVIVVLNSLRLRTLGRDGLAAIGSPQVMRGRRGVVRLGCAADHPLRRSDRGQPSAVTGPRPVAPSHVAQSSPPLRLPHGGSVESYLDPGGVGVNQFHLIFSGTPGTAGRRSTPGYGRHRRHPPTRPAPAQAQPGHYTDFVVIIQDVGCSTCRPSSVDTRRLRDHPSGQLTSPKSAFIAGCSHCRSQPSAGSPVCLGRRSPSVAGPTPEDDVGHGDGHIPRTGRRHAELGGQAGDVHQQDLPVLAHHDRTVGGLESPLPEIWPDRGRCPAERPASGSRRRSGPSWKAL